jgi:hypothetical protein
VILIVSISIYEIIIQESTTGFVNHLCFSAVLSYIVGLEVVNRETSSARENSI